MHFALSQAGVMTKNSPITITEKILAAHSGKKLVSPGEILNVRIDLTLGNDITAPLAIQAFQEIGHLWLRRADSKQTRISSINRSPSRIL
jgi:homoaconitase/3-isopropylmalate dehydratase large subunit